MKGLLLLCILPVVFCAPEKRLFLDTFPGLSGFNLDVLKCDIQLMLDALGGDPTEAACETECHKLLQQGQIFAYSCPLVCHGFQSLVHLWHVVPDSADGTHSQCQKGSVTTTVSA